MEEHTECRYTIITEVIKEMLSIETACTDILWRNFKILFITEWALWQPPDDLQHIHAVIN